MDSCKVSIFLKFKTLPNVLGLFATLMQHPLSITWYILGRKVTQAPHKFRPQCVLWVGLPMVHSSKILFSIFTNYLFFVMKNDFTLNLCLWICPNPICNSHAFFLCGSEETHLEFAFHYKTNDWLPIPLNKHKGVSTWGNLLSLYCQLIVV